MPYTAEQVNKIEAALRNKGGLDEAEVQRIVGLIRPKAKVQKVEVPLTLAEADARDRLLADDTRSEDYKSRLWSSYHQKANAAGRRNGLALVNEIEEIKNDPNVRGLARFC